MKLFGFNKLKDKLNAQRFEYNITIHNLQPWPDSGNRAVAIGWQRGKDKRGATKSVYPSNQPGKLGCVARFNDRFTLVSTLYRAPNGSANANQLGPFKKKCLILAVLETDGRTQATAALGRVVVDLAEFAAIDKQETRAFMVSCNRQIHAAVGDPQLLITIRTRLKKAAAGAGAGGGDIYDDTGSMSTDTTGSRMTQNLSSFLRYKYTGTGPATVNEEQDLRGFEQANLASMRQREANNKNSMSAIAEYDDDDPGSPDRFGQRQLGTARQMSQPPPRAPAYPGAQPIGPAPANSAGPMEGGLRARYGGVGSVSVGNPPPSHQPPAHMAAAAAKLSHLSLSNGSYDGNGMLNSSPRNSNPDDPYSQNSTLTPPGSGVRAAMGLQHVSSMSMDTAQNELVMTAATEISVHLARAVASNSRRYERAAHAAARRIARTMVCLGPNQAPMFGMHVLRLINAQLEVSQGELTALAFWWSNLAQLRALLAQCSGTGQVPPIVVDQVLPQVLRLERVAFDHVMSYLWDGVLLQAVTEAAEKTSSSRSGGASSISKRAQQEAAIKRWLDGLRQVSNKLNKLQVVKSVNPRAASASSGHVIQLRQQALQQCLKRVDALLFHHLVSQPGRNSSDLMSDYDPSGTLWGPAGTPAPALDDASLPFTHGLLTFGSGMSVKMMVTRLQQWATTEGSALDGGDPMMQGGMGGAGGNTSSLFPLLRAAADLLMMPKELLMESTIRADVCQALSIRTVLHMLRAFQPDEFAVDAISPEVLRTLQDEEMRWGATMRPPLTDMSITYRAPPEEQLLGKVNQQLEPGVEYDGDSEDELVGFGGMAAPPGCNTRFRLLHELWYSGSRFRGAVSVTSSSRGLGSQM